MNTLRLHITPVSLIVALIFANAFAHAQVLVKDNNFAQCLNNSSGGSIISGNTLDTISSKSFFGSIQCAGMSIESIDEIVYVNNAKEVYLSNNMLTSIPSFETFTNADTIDISHNTLSFKDLNNLSLLTNYREIVNAFPQNNLSENEDHIGYANGFYKLPFLEDSSLNNIQYAWYKNGVNDEKTGPILFIKNMDIKEKTFEYSVRLTQNDIWGENYLTSGTTRITIDSFPKIKLLEYTKPKVYCNNAEFSFNIEFEDPSFENKFNYTLINTDSIEVLSNGTQLTENTAISLKNGSYFFAINNENCSYIIDSSIIVKEIVEFSSLTTTIDSSNITCEKTPLQLHADFNQDTIPYTFELTNREDNTKFSIKKDQYIELPHGNYTIEIISDSNCLSQTTEHITLIKPDTCVEDNELCYDIKNLTIENDYIVYKDYLGIDKVSINISGPTNEYFTYSLLLDGDVIQTQEIPTFTLTEEFIKQKVYTIAVTCELNKHKTLDEKLFFGLNIIECPTIESYKIDSIQDCSGTFLSLSEITFEDSSEEFSYYVIAKKEDSEKQYILSSFPTEVEKGIYSFETHVAEKCIIPFKETKDLSELNCSKVLYLENEESTIFIEGSGEAELINEIGEFIMNVHLPIEWKGTDANGTLLPTGLYGVRYKNGKIDPITIIR